jgi:hypothetical protein
MAQLKLIPGDAGKRECGPDEYEVAPTFLGLRGWEADQAQERRKAFRIIKGGSDEIPVAG